MQTNSLLRLAINTLGHLNYIGPHFIDNYKDALSFLGPCVALLQSNPNLREIEFRWHPCDRISDTGKHWEFQSDALLVRLLHRYIHISDLPRPRQDYEHGVTIQLDDDMGKAMEFVMKEVTIGSGYRWD
jgi:hypothetical protein